MSSTLIAFIVGIFVGVPLGIFIIGLLQLGREKPSMPEPPENINFVPLQDWGPLTENGKQKTENGTKTMPLYEYQCVDCQVKDHRIGGLDDHTALCVACGGLMLRQDQDILRPISPPIV